MVLVDHIVRLVDEVEALIEEEGWFSFGKDKLRSQEEIIQEMARHQEVAERAFLELRSRKASRPSATAVRKERITFACDTADEAAYFDDIYAAGHGAPPF